MQRRPHTTTIAPALYVRDPLVPLPHRIVERRIETPEVVTLHLQPDNGFPGLGFEAGQFNMLYVFGQGEVPVSVSGAAADQDTLVHTTRSVGAVSRAICELGVGDTVGVRGPFGTTWPLKQMRGKDLVIVAGGIGLAPLRPAIYHVAAERELFGDVSVLVGARQPDQLLFRTEFESWRRAGIHVDVTVDTGPESWSGHVGVVTELIQDAEFDPWKTVALVCGPEIMMRFTAQVLADHGVRSSQIYVTMERNMKCAVGFCGRCQFGPEFICKDGPVFRFADIEQRFFVPEM